MLHWRKLPAWILRAWPLLGLLPFAGLHYIALVEYAHSSQLVNKLMGMTLQVIGGLVILWAIDENLGLFKRRSLISAFFAWLSEFPIKRPTNTVILTGTGAISMSGHASLTGTLEATTVEARLAYLEKALEATRHDMQKGFAAADQKLTEAKSELGARIEATVGQVTELSSRIERATVGGFKTQVFGVLLAIYGACTSVFA